MTAMLEAPPHPLKRVLIADDHPLYRDALRTVLAQAYREAELCEACTQQEVIEQVPSDDAFDLILLDLHLPGADGLSGLTRMRALAPLTPVLIVSGDDDPATMSEAILAGATGYVPKSSPRQVLLDAIRAIMGGGTYLPSPALATMRRDHTYPRDRKEARAQLTSRQRRVLELLADGLSNKRIAGELIISEITVKRHVSAILKRLGVSNRVQAAIEARRLLSGLQSG